MHLLFFIVVMAIAQGIAEFLPVSSSGHLLVLGNWFGFDGEKNMMLNVMLHAGTLLAIVVFYFKNIINILLQRERRRLIWLVIAGSVPAAVVGFGLKLSGLDEKIFSQPWIAAIGFAITGTLLLTVFGTKKSAETPEQGTAIEKLSWKQAIMIGCTQALAITPGISRSGSTISAAVMSGMKKSDAAEFSFLLAIPAIGGATLLEIVKIFKTPADAVPASEWGALGIGFIVSAVVGYAALAGLITMLKKGRLGWFAFYLYTAAAVTAAVEIIRIF